MLVVGNVKLNQIWIEKNQVAYEVVGYQKEYDFENNEMYRAMHLKNLMTGYIIAIAENIVEKRFELDYYGQRQNRKEIVA
ncbi:MAG TPA: hypothetical protein VK590_11395 [Saprospiraceae bacterium]|nr:hypothetical protein [Saprospiraceae bacterium]